MYYANCAPAIQTKRRPARRSYYKSSMPSANIGKSDDGYEINLAIPGFSKKDLIIELEDQILKVRSKIEKTDDELNYKLKEFDYQSFERSFRLSKDADIENISASMDMGILKIKIPYLPEVPAKKVIIK